MSADGECKELLLVLASDGTPEVQVFCVDIQSRPDSEGQYPRSEFVYSIGGEAEPQPNNSKLKIQNSTFLFEPNASVMKAGCFDEIARAYGICAISRNSHLVLSDREIDGFPGRTFAIDAVTTMNKRQLRQTLSGMKQANIAVRNFPLSVAELRKRLKLNDGGDTYIFATTTSDGDHILMLTHKTKK